MPLELKIILVAIVVIGWYIIIREMVKTKRLGHKLKKEVEKEKREPKIFRSVYPFDKEEWDNYVQQTRI